MTPAHLPYSSFENFLFSIFEPDVNGFLLCLSLCLFAYWSNIATLSLNDSWKEETAIEFLSSHQFYIIRRTSVFFNRSPKLIPRVLSISNIVRFEHLYAKLSKLKIFRPQISIANNYRSYDVRIRCFNEKKLDRSECHGEEKWKLVWHIDKALNKIFEARKAPFQ